MALLRATIEAGQPLPPGTHRSEAAFARRLLAAVEADRVGRGVGALQTALTLRARVAYHRAVLESAVPV